MNRIMRALRLDKIAAVDRPCQEGAVVTIMKRKRPENSGDLEKAIAALATATDETLDDSSLGAARVAKMVEDGIDFADDVQKSTGCSFGAAVTLFETVVRDAFAKRGHVAALEGDEDEDSFDKLLRKGAEMPTTDKNSVAGILDDYAKAQRQPGETHSAAYLRLVKNDSFAKSLFATHQAVHRDGLQGQTIAKRVAPEGGTAYAAITALGDTIRKREPKLTMAQAFTKAYCDPANRGLVEICKREQRGLPPDAA